MEQQNTVKSRSIKLILIIVAVVFVLSAITVPVVVTTTRNNATATTQGTTDSSMGNLYNTDGSLNRDNVNKFLNKINASGIIASKPTFTGPQIASRAGTSGSFVFEMGYYVSTSGTITTSKPIKWQAVYSKNGYLTIWMADNYTQKKYSNLTNEMYTVYNTLQSKFTTLKNILASPQVAGSSWQVSQPDVSVTTTSYVCTNNGLSSTNLFWAPSAYEIYNTKTGVASQNTGLWELDNTARAYNKTTLDGGTNSNTWCWMRSGYSQSGEITYIVNDGSASICDNSYTGGIRPACHLDLVNLGKLCNFWNSITASINNADTNKASLDKTSASYVPNSGTQQHTFIYTANEGYAISKVTINGATVAISEIQPEEFAYAVGCKFKCFRDLQKVYVIVTECWENVDIVAYCDIVFNTTTLTTDLKVVSSTATSNASTMDARIILEYNWSPNIRFSLDSGEWIKLVGNSGGGVVGSATYNFSRHEAKFYVIIEIYGLTQAVHNVQVDYYAGGASSITPSIYNNSGSATFEQYDDGNGISRIVVTPASGSYVYSMFIDNVEFPIEYYKAEVYGTGTATSIQYIAKDTNNTFIVLAQNVYKNMNIQFQLVQQVPELKVPPTTGASITGTVATANTGGEVRMVGSDTIEGETAQTITFMAVAYSGYSFVNWIDATSGEVLGNNLNLVLASEDAEGKIIKAVFTPKTSETTTNSQTDNTDILI